MVKPRRTASQITCCVFDLETSGLNADFGVVLCGVIKPAGGEPRVFRADKINADWQTRRSDDSAVLTAITEELSKYDIWVAHNGQWFDVPFLRTRLAKHGLPPLPQKKLIDTRQLARNKFRVAYNSLDCLATMLGVNSKTPLDPETWAKASLDGCRRSMNAIVEHCVEDVKTLELVLDALKSYASGYNHWGSGV